MTIIVVAIFILLAVAVPVGAAFALPTILGASALGVRPETFAASVPYETAMSFTLVAIPYFLLAGQVMQQGGLMVRLVDFANSMLGWLKGALGYVTVAASAMLGAVTGSSVATVATVGSTVGNSMREHGYKPGYIGALCAACGLMGVLIPPSIPLIIYSSIGGVPIGQLFLGALVPGLLMILAFMLVHRLLLSRALPEPALATAGVAAPVAEAVSAGESAAAGEGKSKGKGNEKGSEKDSFIARTLAPDTVPEGGEATLVRKGLGTTAVRALPALLMPVVLFGGLYSGVMTPTEAAAVAALYGLVITLMLRSLKFRALPAVFYAAALPSIAILSIVVFSSVFSRMITLERIPQSIAQMATSFTTSTVLFLIAMNVVLLVVGMFMETNAAVLLMAPLFIPAALQFDIDPVHFGIILVTNIELGLLTPPLAANLYVAAKVTRAPIVSMVRFVWPFFLAALVMQMFITFVPFLTTWHLS